MEILIQLFSGLVGAIIGGAMAVWGSMKALNTTMANLERAEIRRMRVECVANLAGLRFVLGEVKAGQIPVVPDAEIAKLMFELNRISMLWADNADVLKSVRDFHAEPGTKDRLLALIRTC